MRPRNPPVLGCTSTARPLGSEQPKGLHALNAGTSSPARVRGPRPFLSGAKRVLSLPVVALAGIVFHLQSLVFAPGVNALGGALSDALVGLTGVY